MLFEYLDMLRKAIEAMTNLGNSGTTWKDYFQTVGFELLTLLIGIAYLAGLALIVAVPVIGIYKIVKTKTTFNKYLNDRQAYEDFRDEYLDLRDSLDFVLRDIKSNHAIEKEEEKKRIIDKIITMMDSKNIEYEKESMIFDTPEDFDKLPCLPHVWLCDKCDLPGDFAPIGNPKTYGHFTSFEMMKWMGIMKKAAMITLLLLLYAVFIVPLVFVLI